MTSQNNRSWRFPVCLEIVKEGFAGALDDKSKENNVKIANLIIFILKELRKFKEPYVTGTEVVHPTEEPVPRTEGLDDEILITLREIRDILKNR